MVPPKPSSAIALSLADAARAASDFVYDMSLRFFERSAETRGLLLAAIAEENILLLGPPGTAKSEITSAFADAIGKRTFVRLLGRTTQPEELFGPFDLSGLDETPSRFERVTTGYLPTAEVAFLDEIFKANSAILNSLLTILNERCFDQGTRRDRVPLQLTVGASNEYPAEEGLAALYDRFMLRYWVQPLQSDAAFADMLCMDVGSIATPYLDPGALAMLRDAARTVDISGIVHAIVQIRKDLATEHQITPSDRRWRKATKIIRASAVLDGRIVATPKDLRVLADVLWDRREQRDAILEIIVRHSVSRTAARAEEIARLADAIRQEIPASWASLRPSDIGAWTPKHRDMEAYIAELSRLTAEDPAVENTLRSVRVVHDRIVAGMASALDSLKTGGKRR